MSMKNFWLLSKQQFTMDGTDVLKSEFALSVRKSDRIITYNQLGQPSNGKILKTIINKRE